MTKLEAHDLAAQLSIPLPKHGPVKAFEAALETRGLEIGLDMKTGEWVVLEKGAAPKDRQPLARCI